MVHVFDKRVTDKGTHLCNFVVLREETTKYLPCLLIERLYVRPCVGAVLRLGFCLLPEPEIRTIIFLMALFAILTLP